MSLLTSTTIIVDYSPYEPSARNVLLVEDESVNFYSTNSSLL